MKNFLISLWQEEDGQDLVEYGLLVALVALAAVVGMKGLADAINTTFSTLGTTLTGYKRLLNPFPIWRRAFGESIAGPVESYWEHVQRPGSHLLARKAGGRQMKALLRRLWSDEEGQDLVEYGLPSWRCVALAAIAGMNSLRRRDRHFLFNYSDNFFFLHQHLTTVFELASITYGGRGSDGTPFSFTSRRVNLHEMEMRTTLKQLWAEEEGQDLVEYALVVALIGLASVAAMNNVAGLLDTAFSNAVANMSSTTT